jgi:hypothetical protein
MDHVGGQMHLILLVSINNFNRNRMIKVDHSNN